MSDLVAATKRYLWLGREVNYYTTEELSVDEFIPGSLSEIERLSADISDKDFEALLQSAASSGLSTPALLANFLSRCSLSECLKLRINSYSSISTICLSSTTLFLFAKFMKTLASQTKRGVWGGGCRRGIAQWYSSKDVETLARILYAEKSGYGWTHKDLLKLIHFKAPEPLVEAVVSVFAFKKEASIDKLNDKLKDIANKLKDLNKTESAPTAAILLAELQLSPDHIPQRFIHSAEVWAEVVRYLPLPELLKRLEFLTTQNLANVILPIVTAILKEVDGSKLDPTETYFALKRYEVCANYTRKERALEKKRAATTATGSATVASGTAVASGSNTKNSGKDAKKGKKKIANASSVVKPCPTITTTLQELLVKSLGAIPKGTLKWLIVIDMVEGGSYGLWCMPGATSVGVAAFTTCSLLRYAQSATVLAADGKIEVAEADSVAQVAAKFRKIKPSAETLSKTMTTAKSEKFVADIVVYISDQKKKCETQLRAIMGEVKNYQTELGVLTKLATIFLKSTEDLTVNDPNVLSIRGYDSRVSRIIDAFARGEL